ncbi:MAG: hypothetical protein GY710_13955 [Desulfobacteraceae bacterium]|nr:hypothetical protein [Desulfobacteraceae bacterium]
MKKQIPWIFLLFSIVFMIAFSNAKPSASPTEPVPDYPNTRFIVISDLHFYDSSLGVEGKAFQDYLNRDRKMLVLSDEIIGVAMEKIAMEKADFVLVAGDLTKDGEQICHLGIARHLQTLKNSGKQVFVVPGNHDVNNTESVRFVGDTTEPVPNIDPAGFKKIYHELGYGEAIAQDPDSLSYVVEPVQGLRVLALDSNRYKENRAGHHPITGGAFSKKTLAWIETQLLAAQKEKKAVIVFQHHGIIEHYPDNEKFYDQYLVADREMVAALFARYNVRLVFTGHFHAQDITEKKIKNTDQLIFDIETGSMVTAPCPYRMIEFAKNEGGSTSAFVSSQFIMNIPSLGDGFADYAVNYVFEGTKTLVNTSLTKYRVSKKQHSLINAQVAQAYTAHLGGDEKKPETIIDTEGFGLWLKFVSWIQKDLVRGWYTDLAPPDNNIIINLGNGRVQAGE